MNKIPTRQTPKVSFGSGRAADPKKGKGTSGSGRAADPNKPATEDEEETSSDAQVAGRSSDPQKRPSVIIGGGREADPEKKEG